MSCYDDAYQIWYGSVQMTFSYELLTFIVHAYSTLQYNVIKNENSLKTALPQYCILIN